MWSPLPTSALPTAVHVTVGARLTLPASTAEETVRGSGRQVRLLRAATLDVLIALVSRELRAHALTHCGETKSSRPTKVGKGMTLTPAIVERGAAAVALEVIAALDAGDVPGAARAHAEGFGLPVELPQQLGGAFGDVEAIPTPAASRARQAADRQAALLAELEGTEEGAEVAAGEPEADEGLLAA